jgi:hypothetical protein
MCAWIAAASAARSLVLELDAAVPTQATPSANDTIQKTKLFKDIASPPATKGHKKHKRFSITSFVSYVLFCGLIQQ